MDSVADLATVRNIKTVWISDVHLGSPGCRAEYLADFLHSVHCQTLYLVGDIVDFWSLRRRSFWPQAHNDVVRQVLSKAKNGVRVVFVPGNHDEVVRPYNGLRLGNIEILDYAIHTTADGRKLLVIHGDQFDCIVKHSKALAVIGAVLYELLLKMNRLVNIVRRQMNKEYWSLAAFLKHKVKNAVQFIGRYEQILAAEAARRGVDGIVCGHIHRPEIAYVGELAYFNCGDWVESCTALIERWDGVIELVHWTERSVTIKKMALFAAPAATDIAA